MRGLGLWLTLGLVFLHLLLHVGLGFGRGAPDLFVVALLVVGRLSHPGAAAGFGFALGLLEDAFSALSFGANAFSMTVTGIAASRSKDLFVGDSTLFLVFYFALGKWMRELLAWLVSDSSVRGGFVDGLILEAPLDGLYVSVIGILVVSVLRSREGGWE